MRHRFKGHDAIASLQMTLNNRSQRFISERKGPQGQLEYCAALSGLSGEALSGLNRSKTSCKSRKSDRKKMGNEATPTFVDVGATKTKPDRRIVKAKVRDSTPENLQIKNPSGVVDEEDAWDKKGRVSIPHYSLADSPVRRELIQEEADSTRNKRIESAKGHQSAKREKIVMERRLHPKPKDTTIESPKPNPFSKFISSFSVACKHPEHKRAFQVTPLDKDDLAEPMEKRPRADQSLPESPTNDDDGSYQSNLPVILTTVAVVVLAFMVAWNRRK